MIISSGYNIAAPEVEEALLKHPEVAECAVIGVPDEARGSLVKAFVVLTDTAPGSPEKAQRAAGLRQGARSRRTSTRGSLEFVDALPRTATGKLQRFRLRQDCVGVVEIAPRQLILSLYGLYAREEGDWLSVASLIALMADLGVDSAAVRSSVSRLKRRGVLEAARRDGRAGYALSPSTLEVLREGDQPDLVPATRHRGGRLAGPGLLGARVRARSAARAAVAAVRPRLRHRRARRLGRAGHAVRRDPPRPGPAPA